MMNPLAVFLEIVNIIVITIVMTKLLRAENRMLFWSPLFFFTFSWGYYSVIGLIGILMSGDSIDRGLDMGPYITPALLAGLIFFLCALLGYRMGRGHSTSMIAKPRFLSTWYSAELGKHLANVGVALMVLGTCMLIVVAGAGFFQTLNPFSGKQAIAVGYTGAFANYFGYGIQLFIPGCIFLALSMRRYPRARYLFFFALVFTLAIYLSQGFRYRLVLLGGGLLAAYYLDRWERPSVAFQVASLFLTVLAMGFVGATREYGLGLQLERVKGENVVKIFQGGLGDAGIFLTSGAVISVIPEKMGYAGLAPIKGMLLLPIPRAIFEDKDTAGYVENILAMIYGRETQTGAAYMFFAEWYYAFGWAGLIVASLFFGYVMGRMWNWFLRRSDNIYAIALYSCLMPFSYVVLSRGYLAQVALLFAFGVCPSYFVYRLMRGKFVGAALAPIPPRASFRGADRMRPIIPR